MLDEIGVEGQQRLLRSHALVIGAGGLGSPVALYLGTAGVGRITVVDHDVVDLTNLQRQIAHNLSRVGQPKADSVRATRGRDQPRRAGARAGAPRRRRAAGRPGAAGRRGAGLHRQLRHPPRQSTPPACGTASRWCRARRSASTARSRCTTRARRDAPCYACLFPPEADVRRGGLRHDGRVRAAGGHHRLRAGGRGAETARRRGPIARRPAADAGRRGPWSGRK